MCVCRQWWKRYTLIKCQLTQECLHPPLPIWQLLYVHINHWEVRRIQIIELKIRFIFISVISPLNRKRRTGKDKGLPDIGLLYLLYWDMQRHLTATHNLFIRAPLSAESKTKHGRSDRKFITVRVSFIIAEWTFIRLYIWWHFPDSHYDKTDSSSVRTAG